MIFVVHFDNERRRRLLVDEAEVGVEGAVGHRASVRVRSVAGGQLVAEHRPAFRRSVAAPKQLQQRRARLPTDVALRECLGRVGQVVVLVVELHRQVRVAGNRNGIVNQNPDFHLIYYHQYFIVHLFISVYCCLLFCKLS